MGDAGLFGDSARMELLDGEVIEMSPIGSPHAGCVNRLTRLLVTALGHRAVVAVQNPVILDERSEPQPDLAVLRPRHDEYSESHARPDEILLLIEVSETTLAFDLERKAPYYARVGVTECWVADLAGEQIVVMRNPAGSGYETVREAFRDEVVDIQAMPGIQLAVADVLGPSRT